MRAYRHVHILDLTKIKFITFELAVYCLSFSFWWSGQENSPV